MEALTKIAEFWNNRTVSRNLLIDVADQIFDWSKPVKLDDASYLMIEDINGIGHRPSMKVYSKLLNQSYDVLDYNPFTKLVRFYLHTGEIASNNIVCFKSNL